MGNLVDYETDRGIAIITLRDPPVNSFTHEMLSELDSYVLDARFDDDVRVIVVTGHGENYFSAGANITMLREVDPAFRKNFFLFAAETMSRIENTPKVVLAALNGHAVSGGFEIALACDFRIARAQAGSVGFPEIHLGLIPGAGGIQRLARMVGKGPAMQLVLEGEKLPFENAHQLGLIHQVWETATHAEFMANVIEYARRFASSDKAPLALCKAKRAVQAAYENSIDQGLVVERSLLAPLLSSEDLQEGLAAWCEKRAAEFQGK
ncbi:MAG: 2,3-dehydroadipyl-CoA hydratase [Deltaproteobacteria bacterium ADurb.Bin207]|nr:MAG: 2,3-dehydroadipyl-CoA hydratase [Deltaproteobacteria bacterium ADurb.Bin207]HQB45343.1 enoyl-CoA hydratase/isomerase family protein [Polyangiaceae bacterium]